ncbi:hypothetical protein MK489_11395 [Myxococcota bacterium]|nr:hypothetical protein [Myxococcota bacterium]
MPKYISVEEARGMQGLRLVLTAGGPGPWSEAAKGIFHVKGLDYVAVEQVAGGPNPGLAEWTGQTLAPVAILDGEPPAVSFSDIVWLAERLAPTPALVPAEIDERVGMFGLMREITGQQGLGGSLRILMLVDNLERQPAGPGREWTLAFARKFRVTPEAANPARLRVVEVLRKLGRCLEAQRAHGREYLVGDHLSALDITWAAFAALLAPLPEEVCPMPSGLRRMYTTVDPVILEALDPALLEYRDALYRDHLVLPLDF